jgi:sulfoxide reductase heme-binding subunit YedZ
MRLSKRIVRHHLPLLLISAGSSAALYCTRPYPDVLTRLSFSTAYPAMFLLAFTLVTGPCNVLLRRVNPVSSDLRRDTGIWAGILGILHTAVGQCVHLRGRPWLYYIYGPQEHHRGLRHDLFGFANFTGVLSVLLLGALVATSNDFALAAAHAIGYLVIEKQKLLFDITLALAFATTLIMQTAGWTRRVRERRDRSIQPAG